MTLDDLTVNFSEIDSKTLLSDWDWLIGHKKLPILLTASGDAFIQDSDDGSIHVLDTASGSIHEVAGSIDEFKSLLSENDFVVSYFAVEMVGDLIQSGLLLEKGEVYSFVVPPVLGGEYTLENLEKTDIEVHYSISGQIHRQVKDLPPGTPIHEIKLT